MALSHNPYSTYNINKFQTLYRGDLVIMLYNAAIRFIGDVIESIEQNEVEKKVRAIDSSLAIIHELNMSLNFDHNEKLAQNLSNIYSFLTRQLTLANINNDAEVLKPLVDILLKLKLGWQEAIHNEKKMQNKIKKIL